jgi:hypothetical protein
MTQHITTKTNTMVTIPDKKTKPTTTPDGIPDYYRIPEGSKDILDVLLDTGISHSRACAIEYIFRAGRKTTGYAGALEDLKKAVTHLNREIARVEKALRSSHAN